MALSIGYGCFVLFLLFLSDFFVLLEVVPHSLFHKSFILASYKSREKISCLTKDIFPFRLL
jgi:hypothetical protein